MQKAVKDLKAITRKSSLTMKFTNKRYFTTQKFEIKKSSLKVDRKNLFDAMEYEIPFDHINNKIKIQTLINNNTIIVGILLMIISFLFLLADNEEITIILLIFGVIFTVLSFINRKKVVTITTYDENNIELYFRKQNKQEVIEYANSIIQAADYFLLQKFSKIDRLLPIEPQLQNIQYLLNRDIISEDKFETLKNQLFGKENQSTIGFGTK